jgi:predicted acyltransferase
MAITTARLVPLRHAEWHGYTLIDLNASLLFAILQVLIIWLFAYEENFCKALTFSD